MSVSVNLYHIAGWRADISEITKEATRFHQLTGAKYTAKIYDGRGLFIKGRMIAREEEGVALILNFDFVDKDFPNVKVYFDEYYSDCVVGVVVNVAKKLEQ